MKRYFVAIAWLLFWIGAVVESALAQSSVSLKTSFGAGSIGVGESTSLTFEIVASDELTAVTLNDSLPSGLVVASPNQFTGFMPEGACAGGTLTATPGSGAIRLSGATLGGATASKSCTFAVNVTGMSAGLHENSAMVLSDQAPDNTSRASIRVDRAGTATQISSTADVITSGESVTFLARVTVVAPGKGAPTGVVTFRNGSTALGVADLSPNGDATLSTKIPAAGEHSIAAAYEGDSNFIGSSSDLTIAVHRMSSRTIIGSSADHVTFGLPITWTATVTGSAGMPTGAVTFYAGSEALGSVSIGPDGIGRIVSARLTAGEYAVTALYEGDQIFAPSRSAPLIQVIEKAATMTTVSTASSTITAGESAVFTVKVTNSGSIPTGTGMLTTGSTTFGPMALSPAGTANLTAKLKAGSHRMIAEYAGDANHLPSESFLMLSVVQPGAAGDEFRIAAFLLIALIVGAALVVLRRIAILLIRQPLRFVIDRIIRPIRNRTASLRRRVRFLSRAAPAEKPLDSFVGLSVSAISAALTETDAAIEKALADQSVELKQKNLPDQSVELKQKSLLFCRWINPNLTHNPEYERDRAEADVVKAIEFLKASVPITANHLNLYDDIEGAFIVRLFSKSDPACFYVLSSFRKAINSNVVALATFCTIVIYFTVLANVAYSTRFDFHSYIGRNILLLPNATEFYGFQVGSQDSINKFFFAVTTCILAYGFMALYFHLIYGAFQRHNGQQMDRFLNRYLADINGHFQKIHRNASQAVVEERKDLHTMQADAVLWITNLQWMAFRVFFIECFLRNILFQARRNSSFSLALIPLVILIPISLTLVLLDFPQFRLFPLFVSDLYHQNIFYLLFFWLITVYVSYWGRALAPVSESVDGEWFKFRELDINKAMTTVVESYINQLDQWRSRYRERAGPGA